MTNPRYPLFIPSKGRSDHQITTKVLDAYDVPYRVVVEDTEYDAYAEHYPPDKLLATPFHDLGLGPVPVRNWIRRHAEHEGYAKHWQLDDNIRGFRRLAGNQRITCHAGIALTVAEDWADRYENVGITGLNPTWRVIPGSAKQPVTINRGVGCCCLIDHNMPVWWRSPLGDDDDLCLQALSQGWCSVAINAFMIDKIPSGTMHGGIAPLYAGDGRTKVVRSLQRLWPGLVQITRKGQYPHMKIAWNKLDVAPILKQSIDLAALPARNEYGLTFQRVSESGHASADLVADIAAFEHRGTS
jgi:hypothetical protein